MTVYTIHEDSHGLLAIVKEKTDILKYLIENNWITKKSDWFGEERTETLEEAFGENWKQKLFELELDEVEFRLFQDWIYYDCEVVVHFE